MTDVHRCPRCRDDHPRLGPCPLDGPECGAAAPITLGARAARCILAPAHAGPHWGPTIADADDYREWPLQ